MLSKLNLNKFKEQKWLYFFIGSLFTALIAGGLVYFDVYNVIGQSVLRSDPTMSKPALYAEGRSEVLGGIVTNTASDINQKAESGLIVLGGVDDSGKLKGKVGIGFGSGEIPSEMLEVKGNIKIQDRADTTITESIIAPQANIPAFSNNQVSFGGSLRLTPDGIEHLEERNTGTYYYWAYGNCSCFVARSNESRLADANNLSSLSFGRAIKKYLGSLVLPAAQAKASCYNTEQECIDAGGSYCLDYGDSCLPGEYDIEISCTYSPTADAQCDTGDTQVSGAEDYDSCYGTQYLGSVQCKRDTSGVDWYSKIRFSGTPDGIEPSQTIIDDDLVVNNNKPSNCGWVSGNQCGDGKFMAGYDSLNDQIYCCEL